MDDMDRVKTVTVVLFILLSSSAVDGAILSHKKFEHTLSQVESIDINDARQLLHRHRRDASTTGDWEKMSSEVVLDGTEDHTQAYVHWSGKLKSEAVFILTLKYNGSKVSESQTWRSLDYGTTYNRLPISSEAIISFFYVSPVDHKKMVFTDVENQRLYTSTDEMHTTKNWSLPAASDAILMHPRNSSWMLLYDYFQRNLYVSQNFGEDWNLLQSEVNPRYFWGVRDVDGSGVVHMEYQPQYSEQAFYKRCTIPHCQGADDHMDYNLGPFMPQTMLLTNLYIFVQKSNLDGTDSHMMVSYNGSQFSHTYFPANVKTKDFLILDAAEGQVFVAVNHGDRMGVSLYLSDPTGRYYVLSLPAVHHSSASMWFDVDMHRVQGLNATYLANQQMDSSQGSQLKLKSLVSFDKGGTWQEVPSPKKPCASDDCALLLRLDMVNFMQDWILSETRAPGFLIAHGHYGRNYQHDLQNLTVFTSMDGGWTWTQSQLRGVYHFNILDQGSIVTAVKTGSQEETNTVYYSWNEGKEWKSGNFGEKKLIVDGVLNEPGINTVVVSIYGHSNTSAPWTMVKLNFSLVLSNKCANDDYVTWMVSDHDKTKNENCLLGQQVIYKRRKQDSKCFNGEEFVRTIQNKTCQCVAEDFECDFGFAQKNGKCVPESWYNNGYIAPECTVGKTFKKSRGYRKVGSDQCVGGVSNQTQYQPDPSAPCPSVAPGHLLLVANLTIVATAKPVHFHLSQKRGSVSNTEYTWRFNDSQTVKLTGLTKAQQQTHSFTKAGTYSVRVSASIDGGKTTAFSNVVTVRVEDVVHTLGVFYPWAVRVGFPVSVSVASSFQDPSTDSSLHFLYRFGDEGKAGRGELSWDPNVSHKYTKAATYTLSVTAINSVSAVTRQVTVKVIDDGIMVQLGFSTNAQRLFHRGSFSSEHVFYLLESLSQELARMLAVNLDRLVLTMNSTRSVLVDALIMPPPPDSKGPEPTPKQIVQTLKDMVGNKTLTLFRMSGLPRSFGDISVTSITVLDQDSGGDGKQTGANYHPLYIAIPIVLLAAVVTGLVLLYYRRRFRNIRRYSMVNQDEDTDALLDEEDEPPLDLRSESREGARSRDDAMLDLGTGSHLVMVTGNGGGGDGAENC